MPTETDTLSLIRTKLYRPRVNVDLVPRPRLPERLEARRERPLTLVSAAADHGKTTLVNSWLDSYDCPSAWVSLEEEAVEVEPAEGQQRGWIVAVVVIAAVLILCMLQQDRDTQTLLGLVHLILRAPPWVAAMP